MKTGGGIGKTGTRIGVVSTLAVTAVGLAVGAANAVPASVPAAVVAPAPVLRARPVDAQSDYQNVVQAARAQEGGAAVAGAGAGTVATVGAAAVPGAVIGPVPALRRGRAGARSYPGAGERVGAAWEGAGVATMTAVAARRTALAAQGFGAPRPVA
jgi:hypothetical protein